MVKIASGRLAIVRIDLRQISIIPLSDRKNSRSRAHSCTDKPVDCNRSQDPHYISISTVTTLTMEGKVFGKYYKGMHPESPSMPKRWRGSFGPATLTAYAEAARAEIIATNFMLLCFLF